MKSINDFYTVPRVEIKMPRFAHVFLIVAALCWLTPQGCAPVPADAVSIIQTLTVQEEGESEPSGKGDGIIWFDADDFDVTQWVNSSTGYQVTVALAEGFGTTDLQGAYDASPVGDKEILLDDDDGSGDADPIAVVHPDEQPATSIFNFSYPNIDADYTASNVYTVTRDDHGEVASLSNDGLYTGRDGFVAGTATNAGYMEITNGGGEDFTVTYPDAAPSPTDAGWEFPVDVPAANRVVTVSSASSNVATLAYSTIESIINAIGTLTLSGTLTVNGTLDVSGGTVTGVPNTVQVGHVYNQGVTQTLTETETALSQPDTTVDNGSITEYGVYLTAWTVDFMTAYDTITFALYVNGASVDTFTVTNTGGGGDVTINVGAFTPQWVSITCDEAITGYQTAYVTADVTSVSSGLDTITVGGWVGKAEL